MQLWIPRLQKSCFYSTVEMHIIPHTVSAAMQFDYQLNEASVLKGSIPSPISCWTGGILGSTEAGILAPFWDLGLIGAMIHPEVDKRVKGEGFDNSNIWFYR